MKWVITSLKWIIWFILSKFVLFSQSFFLTILKLDNKFKLRNIFLKRHFKKKALCANWIREATLTKKGLGVKIIFHVKIAYKCTFVCTSCISRLIGESKRKWEIPEQRHLWTTQRLWLNSIIKTFHLWLIVFWDKYQWFKE